MTCPVDPRHAQLVRAEWPDATLDDVAAVVDEARDVTIDKADGAWCPASPYWISRVAREEAERRAGRRLHHALANGVA